MNAASQEMDRSESSPERSAVVERLLAEGYRWLLFPHAIERDYQQYNDARDRRMHLYSGIVGIVLFNLFLICDYMLIPDMWHAALWLRLGVFDPVGIGFALLMAWRPPSPRAQKPCIALACLLDGAIIVWLFSNSREPGAVVYQSGLLLVIMGMNIMLQLNFWHALWASMVVIAMQVVGVMHSPLMSDATRLYSVLVLLTTVITSLIATYKLERDRRFAWLVEMRERGRNQKLVAANRELEALSHRDALTGIHNRRHFDDYVAEIWQIAKARGAQLSLLMVDVDYFKAYNDYYGHPGGDECLRRIAGAIQSALRRSSDIVARYGGEEFVVVLPDAPVQDVQMVADRILQSVDALKLPHEKSPYFKRVTISVGAATVVPTDAESLAGLVQAADSALYSAKSEGRHRIYSADFPASAVAA
jgi:diguanylate cyclase (GGDEF)-like protein